MSTSSSSSPQPSAGAFAGGDQAGAALGAVHREADANLLKFALPLKSAALPSFGRTSRGKSYTGGK